MPRPRRRKLRAGDQVRYTVPTAEIAAYLERWGPGSVGQAITAGLILLMHPGRGAAGGPADRGGKVPDEQDATGTGDPQKERQGPATRAQIKKNGDILAQRLALSAFD